MIRRSGIPVQLLRAAARGISVLSGAARGLVLHYHRVLEEPDPILPDLPDARRFAAQLDAVAKIFRIVPLTQLADALRERAGAKPPVAITFDDGYRDNLDVALPILEARGLSATFFIATGFLDEGIMWNDRVIEALRSAPLSARLSPFIPDELRGGSPADRRRCIDSVLPRLKYLPPAERIEQVRRFCLQLGAPTPPRLMMNAAEVRRLAASGMEVGAHTVTHPILRSLDIDTARTELRRSRETLIDLTGQQVPAFAYPNGQPGIDYASCHVQLVRESGFSLAVTTRRGCVSADSDPLQWPRVAPWDRSAGRFVARLVAALIGSPEPAPALRG